MTSLSETQVRIINSVLNESLEELILGSMYNRQTMSPGVYASKALYQGRGEAVDGGS